MLSESNHQLFLGIKKSNAPVAPPLLLTGLSQPYAPLGYILQCHSTRGSSATAASMAGVTKLAHADWLSVSTFSRFYHSGDQVQSTHRCFSISSLSASKSRCDMDPKPSEVQS